MSSKPRYRCSELDRVLLCPGSKPLVARLAQPSKPSAAANAGIWCHAQAANQLKADTAAASAAVLAWKKGSAATEVIFALNLVETDLNLIPYAAPYAALIDIGIAAEHLRLRAAELGLGTCMMGWFDERRIKRLLRMPSSSRVGLVVAIGHPAESIAARPKNRKALAEIRSYDSY